MPIVSMRKVVDIVKMQFDYTPVDSICCSVCARWRPRVEFCEKKTTNTKFKGKGKGPFDVLSMQQTRTNCQSCYELPLKDMIALKELTKDRVDSWEFKDLERLLLREAELMANSVPVDEMIRALSDLPKDSRVFIGQEGYYCDGRFADCHIPERHAGEHIDGIGFYEIGRSIQNENKITEEEFDEKIKSARAEKEAVMEKLASY